MDIREYEFNTLVHERDELLRLLEQQHNAFRKHLYEERNRVVWSETKCLTDCEICKVINKYKKIDIEK